MFFRIVVAALAASTAVAQSHPKLVKMSQHQAFGRLSARQTNGYTPEQTFCGAGDTCEAACGAGYRTCKSNDDLDHCYNPSAGESCCSSGDSCEAGYYCSADTSGNTFCCPNGMDTVACAAAYSVTGVLVSETPAATPTSSASSRKTDVTAHVTTTGAPTPITTGTSEYSAHNATSTSIRAVGSTKVPTSAPTETAVQISGAGKVVSSALLALAAAAVLL